MFPDRKENKKGWTAKMWLIWLFVALGIFAIIVLVLSITGVIKSNNMESTLQSRIENSYRSFTSQGGGSSSNGYGILTGELGLCIEKIYSYEGDHSGIDGSGGNKKSTLNSITEPIDYLYNRNSKIYMVKGWLKIDLINNHNNTGNRLYTKITYSISSNYRTFSSIKLLEVGLSTKTLSMVVKKTHDICSDDGISERRCDKESNIDNNNYNGIIDKDVLMSKIHIVESSSIGEDNDDDGGDGGGDNVNKELENTIIYNMIFMNKDLDTGKEKITFIIEPSQC